MFICQAGRNARSILDLLGLYGLLQRKLHDYHTMTTELFTFFITATSPSPIRILFCSARLFSARLSSARLSSANILGIIMTNHPHVI